MSCRMSAANICVVFKKHHLRTECTACALAQLLNSASEKATGAVQSALPLLLLMMQAFVETLLAAPSLSRKWQGGALSLPPPTPPPSSAAAAAHTEPPSPVV
eukprot:CAMPEP_0202341206 /NCGR_PEP_ID=MMETSP1126-20121109/2313_1 /ASSEMBLY_ACC=CAM_ASM_000457 /TAXON_ID=3047 /ORGANISM="Dunaliella tertiolecta, Strain CCMP1320" /LENGTH=101 /DNA_ID=CAMNT_0048932015 /DNA_START=407 /DNA_END=712 /DNA_ORIENTATION=-